jgi:Mrp family chromosome partitioning ATPase/uncharacterized protein involved in exopolysaccharide biosynthesis
LCRMRALSNSVRIQTQFAREMPMYDFQSQQFEPTVAGAAWQFRWLVLLLAIGFAGLGWLVADSRAAWTADAVILVEDPRSSNLFDGGADVAPERYVRNQAEIISSLSVARRASEIAAAAEDPETVSSESILSGGLSVDPDEDSGLIRLSFTAEEGDTAVLVANSVAQAYQEISSELTRRDYEVALEELDSEIVQLVISGTEIQDEIRNLRGSDAERLAIQTQLDSVVSRLLLLESTPDLGTPDDYARTAAILNEIGLEIQTLRSALANEDEDPDIQTLQSQYNDVRARISSLQAVRDQRAIDAKLVSSGVVFYDPAVDPVRSSAATLVVFGFLMGAVVGSAAALPLARRRRRFGSRIEPEAALGVPLLADVPSFFEERLSTTLPTVEAPASAAAESFRFVATAVVLQRDRMTEGSSGRAFTSVIVTSTSVSEGKTTVVANAAFAAAREGNRVLVVDADYGDQELTRLLAGSVVPRAGLADVVAGHASLSDAIVRVPMEDAGSVDLLSGGSVPGSAFDFLSSTTVKELFDVLADRYNLILIDGPPLPRVAYSTTLVRLADRVMVVVSHGSDMRGTEELRRRLELVETPLVGYVYNLAPLRPEMTLAVGSMRRQLDRSETPASEPTETGGVVEKADTASSED